VLLHVYIYTLCTYTLYILIIYTHVQTLHKYHYISHTSLTTHPALHLHTPHTHSLTLHTHTLPIIHTHCATHSSHSTHYTHINSCTPPHTHYIIYTHTPIQYLVTSLLLLYLVLLLCFVSI
jgi:hypothetical protein